MKYDAKAATALYDEYGEREWTRFEDGRTPAASVATHTHYLRRFVAHGDRVLDIGCGPGRFTIEQAPRAMAELARATRPGGHVLVSVMALVGATINAIEGVLAGDELGSAAASGVTASGLLPREYGGHLPMKLYRWRELREVELDLGAESGALDAGRHILAVVGA